MTVKEVKPGFEKEAELILSKKSLLESEKEAARAEALRKVDEEFEEREKTIVSILELITMEVEVEEPVSEVEPSEIVSETDSEFEEAKEVVDPVLSSPVEPPVLGFIKV